MELNTLPKLRGKTRQAKRVGRGGGSGKGWHTTGRGHKGQKARGGHNIPVGFEGGQVPLYKRLPQLGGFKNSRAKEIFIVSLDRLNSFKEGDVVTPEVLVEKKIFSKLPKNGVKILANGELKKKLTLKGFLMSQSAKAKLKEAGVHVEDI